MATWREELTHLKRPWCWERLKVKEDDRGWAGGTAPPTWWTRAFVNSRSWWRTGRPSVLQSMGLQRVRHDCVTKHSTNKISPLSFLQLYSFQNFYFLLHQFLLHCLHFFTSPLAFCFSSFVNSCLVHFPVTVSTVFLIDLWELFIELTPVFLGFPGGSAGKESACSVGDLGSIPGLGRSPGEGKGYPLQYSGLEKSMGCIVHGVTKSDMTERLSLHFRDF